MNSIPDYAAIDVCVQISKEKIHSKISGFVNAVLRNIARNKEDKVEIPTDNEVKYLSIKYSYEPWMINLFKNHYKDFFIDILNAGNQKPPIFIKINTLKISKEKLLKGLEDKNIEFEIIKEVDGALIIKKGDILNTDLFNNGYFYVQDLSSQILGLLVDAKEQDTVIDVCSAPGGKSSFLAISMQNKGEIIAIESQKEKIKMMEDNFMRLGLTNIKVIHHDATVDLPNLHNKADKIIVDVPCSALGVIRRHPEKKWCISEKELNRFPPLQFKILDTVKNWVKKDGYIFYSTCTINPEENQNVINKFLDKNDNFELEDILINQKNKLGEYKFEKFFLSLPGNKLNMDGFFIAKIKRIY